MQHTITKMYYQKKLIKYCKSYICLTANIYLTTIHGRIPMLGATGISKCAMRMMFSLKMLVSHTMTNRYIQHSITVAKLEHSDRLNSNKTFLHCLGRQDSISERG